MSSRISHFSVFVVAGLMTAVAAFGQSSDSLLEEGRSAFDLGRYTAARSLLERFVSQRPDSPEAHYLLARIYRDVEPRDPDKAKEHGDRAVSLEPDNPEYLALRLARSLSSGGTFLPNLRTRRKQDLAERILDLDPANELAHFVLGGIALDDYLNARRSVSFPELDNLDVPAPREAFFNAAYLLNPVLEPGVEAGGIQFRASRRNAAREVEAVTKDGEARKRYALAIEHLTKALESNPARKETYQAMLTAAVLEGDLDQADGTATAMISARPEDADAWLYRGFVSFQMNRIGEAEDAFDRALRGMEEAQARELLDTSLFEAEESRAGEPPGPNSFWDGRDPFLLTPQNERRLEHLSRMVYADLRFGGLYPGTPGWRTEPGEVVVRYGVPLGEVQSSTRLDKYLVLHYGDFYFKFMDLAKSGRLTFYSPKVGSGGPDLNEIERAYDEDYTLISKRIFREVPERHIYDRHGARTAMPYMVSAFRGEGGRLDLYVTFGVEEGGEDSSRVRSGVWLLDESGAVVEQATSDAAAAGRRVGRGDGEAPGYTAWTRRLDALPGLYTIVVEYERPSSGVAGFHRRPLRLEPLPPRGPAISDLMLAYSAEEGAGMGAVVRGGYSVEPAPWSVFQSGQPIYVFFETYNLAENPQEPRSYRVEALISPIDDTKDLDGSIRRAFERAAGRGVSIEYAGTARGDVEPQYLILDTAESTPGTYLVGMRLTQSDSGYESFAGRVIILE